MNSAGYHIETGMSVEIPTIFPVAMMGSMIAEPIRRALLAKYGFDLQNMNCLNAGFLKVDKLKTLRSGRLSAGYTQSLQ